MTITDEVRKAIKRTCLEESGGALKLARRAGFTPAQINRYHSGKTRMMTEACWTRLFPHVMHHLPEGFACKILVGGKPENRIVHHGTGNQIAWQVANKEYHRLFGSDLPTREKIESFLAEKIKAYGNEMTLLLFLLDFDRIMDHLAAQAQQSLPERNGNDN